MAISGSGSIDVNSIVGQLMTLEQRPLVALQKRETAIQAKLSAFGRIQGTLSSLQTALDKLRQAGTFGAAQASVAGEGVSATVSGTPAQGRYAVSITQLARAQTSTSDALAGAAASVGAGSLTLKDSGGAVVGTVAFGGVGEPSTLAELRDAINGLDAGVNASIVNDVSGARLALTSSDTGAAKSFSVELTGGAAELAALTTPKQLARDAQFSVNGISLTSASNTVTGVIDGLTLNLTKQPAAGAAPGATIDAEVSVSADSVAMRTAVADFVKAYNDFDKMYRDLTKFDPNKRTAAELNGESILRSLHGSLRNAALGARTAAVGEYTRLSEVGIEVQRDGSLKLNETKLDEALAADRSKVARLFTTKSAIDAEQGFGVRVGDLVKQMTQTGGPLASRQDNLRTSVRVIDAQQDALERRLAITEERLRREYSKLDVLVSSRTSQSDALASALAGLPGVSK